MNYELLFASTDGRPVGVAVIGVGTFTRSLIVYGTRTARISVRVICDLDVSRCLEAYHAAGVTDEQIERCTTVGEGVDALNRGRYVVYDDAYAAIRMPVDVVVEGTGSAEASAAHALSAIEERKHVVMVTKEADSVVGPLLARKASRKGVVYSPAHGDQPALLVSLVSWARTAGLSVQSIGKASEFDVVYDERDGSVRVGEATVATPDFPSVWHLGNSGEATVARRREILAPMEQHAIADLTEMGIVCNHLDGFGPDIPSLHLPILRTMEIADIMCPQERGGILGGALRVDVVNCLRRTDEQSLAGGVYVVVSCDDDETWRVLREKGIPVSRNESSALVYYPAHFLGLEASFSVLSIGVFGFPTGSCEPKPRFDLVARAVDRIPRGTRLSTHGHHREISGLTGELWPAESISRNRRLPFFLADGAVATQDIESGTFLTAEMLSAPPHAVLWRLRGDQDREFRLRG